MDEQAREATYRFLHDLITEQQRALGEERRALETKAAVLAGFAAAAMSFLLDRPGGAVWWCAVAAHGVALALAMAVLWPARADMPFARRLHERLRDVPPDEAVATVVRWKVHWVDRTSWRIGAGTALWCTAVVVLVVGLLLSVWTTMTEVMR